MELAKLVPKWQTSVSKSTVRTRQLELGNRGHRTSRRCVLLEIYIYIHSAMPGNWLESLWISTSYTLWVLNRLGFLCYCLWTCIFWGYSTLFLLLKTVCMKSEEQAACWVSFSLGIFQIHPAEIGCLNMSFYHLIISQFAMECIECITFFRRQIIEQCLGHGFHTVHFP